MTRKVIASVAIGSHKELLDLSIGKLNNYADLYGYEISICFESLDSSRPAAWNKILHILNLMPEFDEILWIDADAIIVDTSKDISEEVSKETDLAWVYHSYGDQSHPNTGVMFIRSNLKTVNLFELANLQTDLTNHPWWDQAAIMRLMGLESIDWPFELKESQVKIEINEQKLSTEWNSIRQAPAEKPRIRHFAGENFWIRKLFVAEYSQPFGSSTQVLEELLARIQEGEIFIAQHQDLVAQHQDLVAQHQEQKIQLAKIYSSRIWKVLRHLKKTSRLDF